MLISVIFSFRNEEANIPELLKQLYCVFEKLVNNDMDYELIFVNDDSTDRSFDILLQHRQKNDRIKVINMSRRWGVSPCVMAGLKEAKGDAVIYMDADLQDPPELIPVLIAKWQDGADIVHTTRTKRHGENALKMWLTHMAYKIINLVSDINLMTNTGDFKLLSRSVVDEVIRLDEDDPFIRGLTTWVGFQQTHVFYEREKRFAGDTHFPLFSKGPIKEFLRGITAFSVLPLYFALIVGFIVSFGAFLYLIAVIVMFYLGWNLPGWSAIMVTMLFLGGTILFTIGVLGIYIGKIYKAIKKRPNFIIREKIGF
jgi:dolichol-phosphate mannosyltransferase